MSDIYHYTNAQIWGTAVERHLLEGDPCRLMGHFPEIHGCVDLSKKFPGCPVDAFIKAKFDGITYHGYVDIKAALNDRFTYAYKGKHGGGTIAVSIDCHIKMIGDPEAILFHYFLPTEEVYALLYKELIVISERDFVLSTPNRDVARLEITEPSILAARKVKLPPELLSVKKH